MSRTRNRAARYSFAGDRGWQPTAEPYVAPDPAPADHGDLRYGLDLTDINAAASIAVRIDGRMAGDPEERFDIAWCGAAEHLYSSPDAVTRRELVHAARNALDQALNGERSTHGVSPHHGGSRGSAPRFAAYWLADTSVTPEDRAVESLALGQIWPRLSARQRQALAALAAFDGDVTAAAAALGATRVNFHGLITTGRARFRELWHEGESPSKHWAQERKSLRRGDGASDHRRIQRRKWDRQALAVRAKKGAA